MVYHLANRALLYTGWLVFRQLGLRAPGSGNVAVLTEHSLPGVRLPPDGVFTPLLSPALQCRSRISGPATNINRIKNIVMTIATHKTSTPASRKRGASKSLPDTIAEAAVPNPLKMATIVLSQEAIGTRAHEI